jgi:hypothetical protein
MENEKDRFGEKMRLVEQAKEDIYFAQKDRELIAKLKEDRVVLSPHSSIGFCHGVRKNPMEEESIRSHQNSSTCCSSNQKEEGVL